MSAYDCVVRFVTEWEPVAVWLEGIALVLILINDRKGSREQHEQTLKQMDIMQSHTKATSDSVNTLINSERAWVMADIGAIPEFEPATDRLQILRIPLTFRNYGRTPARIIRWSARLYPIEAASTLPEEPEYRQTTSVDILLPPNSAVPQGIAITPITVSIGVSDFIPIREARSSLYVYGFVEYIALEDKSVTRETRFCWQYYVQLGFSSIPTGFRTTPDIPSVYTRCT